MSQFYSEDLAYIHDAGFGHVAENASNYLLNVLQQQGIKQGLIVDLGCGSGIFSQRVYAAGYEVFGIDISADFIAIARQRVPQAEFLVESLFTADIPACIAVTAISECLNYLVDENNTTAERIKLFQRIYQALSTGGILLLDLLEPGQNLRVNDRSFKQTEDWAVLVQKEENHQQKQLTRWITTFRKVGELYRRDQEVHLVQLLDGQEIIKELQEIGFQVQVLEGYDHFKFAAGHIGIFAQKF
ncbi:MAG: class I SAM-dependent methyltransferase [Cyanobacteria bacterium J06592_8]